MSQLTPERIAEINAEVKAHNEAIMPQLLLDLAALVNDMDSLRVMADQLLPNDDAQIDQVQRVLQQNLSSVQATLQINVLDVLATS